MQAAPAAYLRKMHHRAQMLQHSCSQLCFHDPRILGILGIGGQDLITRCYIEEFTCIRTFEVHVLDEEVCAWGSGAIWGLCENHPRNIEATWSGYACATSAVSAGIVS